MATKVWTGTDLTLFLAGSGQPEMAPVMATFTSVDGDTGLVNLTTSFTSGGQMCDAVGSLFDDGSVPPVITIDTVRLQFNWSVTNGAKAGGTTSSSIAFGASQSQAEGSFSGSFDDSPTVASIFGGTTRADLFAVPTIGWAYLCSYTGAFAAHNRRIAVSAYTVTVGYTPATTPAVTSVTPSSGSVSGGQAVVIVGEGFTGATDVEFGGIAATSVVVVDDTHITAVTPAHLSGLVDVEVLGVATGTGLYTYVLDTIQLPPMPTRTPMTQGGGAARGAPRRG